MRGLEVQEERMGEWTLRFDGLFEPRRKEDGVATFGFVVEHEGRTVHEGKGLVAPPGSGASANVAEFAALLHGLMWLRDHGGGGCPLRILGDSRLVIETVAGRWRLSSEHLVPLRDLARSLVAEIGGAASLEKVSREENARPDELSREAYHEAVAAHPEWRARRSGSGQALSRGP